jgi:hypothetical protein
MAGCATRWNLQPHGAIAPRAHAVARDAAGGVAAEFAWSSRSTGTLALAGAFAVACPRPIQSQRQGEADASGSEAREGQRRV